MVDASQPRPSPALNENMALVLGFLIAVGPVSVDMYLPAFDAIGKQFGPSTPGLTLAAYFAGFAVGQLAFGFASDRYGRRAPFAAGLIIYTAGSIGCALAFSSESFCFWRALAAFGAAASIVIPRAYVRDLADGPQAAALMSQILAIMSVAPILAPLIGSAVLSVTSWRGIFFVASAYGIVSLLFLLRYIPETLAQEKRSILGVLPTIRLYSSILIERQFITYAVIGSFAMGALFAYLTGSPTVFEGQYQYSAWGYGVVISSIGAATIAFFRLNTSLVRSAGPRRMIVAGISIWLTAGCVLVFFEWYRVTSATAIFVGLVVFALGYSFMPSNCQVMALSRHHDHAATATSLMSALQYFSGALTGAVVGRLADGTAKPMAEVIAICALGATAIAWRYARNAAAA